ncbi:DUF1501 domain-containing protein [bacterium]|nr:DUF1501 domain-containing protein [bacterium]
MHPFLAMQREMTRRHLLQHSAAGIGMAAVGSLLARDGYAANSNSSSAALPGLPHFAPKAKRVIYLLMSGAPSQLDLFENKPMVHKMRGNELPSSVQMGQRLTTMTASQAQKRLLPPIAPVRQRGQSGAWVTDMLPHVASIADELCFIKSMHTEAINHAPAMTMLLTGAEQPGRPSTGAWLSYGLGSENDDLPTFCVMTSRDREGSCGQLFFDYYWGSGFLPTKYQGVKFRSEGGDPVLYLTNPPGIDGSLRRELLDDLNRLNQIKLEATGDPEISTRISQYEMAYRMQTSVPDLVDLSTEPQHVLDLYGKDVTRPGSFARNCLLARRLAERGVRFIQLLHSGWDQHQNLPTQLKEQCFDTDQPSAALVQDLRQRGLLDETLVVWGGEFGRTVFCQGDIDNKTRHGRDHHPRCFTIWMAGGGIKPGMTYGETDDFSYNVARDPVHIHDLQATVLHLLGINHEELTYRYQGRRFRLTDIAGKVVSPILV